VFRFTDNRRAIAESASPSEAPSTIRQRRAGKIQARHPQVNDLYDLALRDTPEGVRLFWEMKEDRRNWRESREGAYLLRTNLQSESAEELWSKYMQLTEAESSFRALKSELSIRPLFHQLEPRVKGM
jgi:transposase